MWVSRSVWIGTYAWGGRRRVWASLWLTRRPGHLSTLGLDFRDMIYLDWCASDGFLGEVLSEIIEDQPMLYIKAMAIAPYDVHTLATSR